MKEYSKSDGCTNTRIRPENKDTELMKEYKNNSLKDDKYDKKLLRERSKGTEGHGPV